MRCSRRTGTGTGSPPWTTPRPGYAGSLRTGPRQPFADARQQLPALTRLGGRRQPIPEASPFLTTPSGPLFATCHAAGTRSRPHLRPRPVHGPGGRSARLLGRHGEAAPPPCPSNPRAQALDTAGGTAMSPTPQQHDPFEQVAARAGAAARSTTERLPVTTAALHHHRQQRNTRRGIALGARALAGAAVVALLVLDQPADTADVSPAGPSPSVTLTRAAAGPEVSPQALSSAGISLAAPSWTLTEDGPDVATFDKSFRNGQHRDRDGLRSALAGRRGRNAPPLTPRPGKTSGPRTCGRGQRPVPTSPLAGREASHEHSRRDQGTGVRSRPAPRP